jgi:hypothetical protein
MEMNNKQRSALLGGLIIIGFVVLLWLVNGGEFFTKTQVLIEKQDQLFGTTYKEWKNTFIWGLDLTIAVSFMAILTSLTITYLLRNKRKEIA